MLTKVSYQVDGRTIAALECGDRYNPVILFLHGIPASAELWREVILGVSKRGWYCIAPDCPGYGDTRLHKDDDYSISSIARWMIKWLKQENFQHIWLVAHDIGVGIAQFMMVQEQTLFHRATISNGVALNNWPVPPIKLMIGLARIRLFPILAMLGVGHSPISIAALKKAVYNKNDLTREKMDRIFIESKFYTAAGRVEYQRMLLALNPEEVVDNLPNLEKITIPVHLIWAMDDPYQPWTINGAELEKRFSNVRVTKLDKAGHFLQIDVPERYIEALLDGIA